MCERAWPIGVWKEEGGGEEQRVGREADRCRDGVK